MFKKKECVAMLLAGGQGSRLYALTKKTAKPAAEKVKYFTEVELSLCEALARKVSVKGNEKGGSITIEFFDKDDLMKIAKLFEE